VKSLWHGTNDINSWKVSQWDEYFHSGIATDDGVEDRQYVLKPVDGDASYVRRATELVGSQTVPHQDIQMHWPEFAMRLSHLQAMNVTLLLQELSRHQARSTSLDRVYHAASAARSKQRACQVA
jgi:hypothetical protein